MKHKMKWLSEWQYSYRKEIISLDMTYGSPNTYGYWLHSAKIRKCGFSTEGEAKEAARLMVDTISIPSLNNFL